MANLAPDHPLHPCLRCRVHGIKSPVHVCEVKGCKCDDCQQLRQFKNPQMVMQCEWIFCICCHIHGIDTRAKHICEYQDCNCERCEKRSFTNRDSVGRVKGDRMVRCPLCRNHDIIIDKRKNNHKANCVFLNCTCPECERTRERQRDMANQVALRRRLEQEVEAGRVVLRAVP